MKRTQKAKLPHNWPTVVNLLAIVSPIEPLIEAIRRKDKRALLRKPFSFQSKKETHYANAEKITANCEAPSVGSDILSGAGTVANGVEMWSSAALKPHHKLVNI